MHTVKGRIETITRAEGQRVRVTDHKGRVIVGTLESIAPVPPVSWAAYVRDEAGDLHPVVWQGFDGVECEWLED